MLFVRMSSQLHIGISPADRTATQDRHGRSFGGGHSFGHMRQTSILPHRFDLGQVALGRIMENPNRSKCPTHRSTSTSVLAINFRLTLVL